MGVIRQGGKGQIALTFDDGPDPVYTPRLLDLLKERGIRATFFVLGSKAEKHPDLIRRMHEEGHQIGIHNYTHLSNWLMTPWGSANAISAARRISSRALPGNALSTTGHHGGFSTSSITDSAANSGLFSGPLCRGTGGAPSAGGS
ncbi:polysaccharide deacetylase family protein [Paenibacillus sp. CC-CFT747]|nr:polysaccharide deacetylase family protein [Paenibacillus sp. CC-CFT747]